MAGHCEERPADHAGPERVLRRQMKREIKKLKFVACGRGSLSYFAPASGNRVQQKSQRHRASGQVQQQLRDIRPDHRFHAAFERVQNRQRDDNHHRKLF